MNFFLIIAFWFFLVAGCSKPYQPHEIGDQKYDTQFPSQSAQASLDHLLSTVHLLTSMSFYQIYYFPLSFAFTRDQFLNLTQGQLSSKAPKKVIGHQTSSGTATVISSSLKSILLATSAHIVTPPDTLQEFYYDSQGNKTPFIKMISLKIKQQLYLSGIKNEQAIEILAFDKENDLALIIVTLRHLPADHRPLPALRFPLGKAEQLTNGTFVYFAGFPGGKRTLSFSLVSLPDDKKTYSRSFFINTPLGKGISGGPVFALRDGVNHFELVGIISSLMAQEKYVLQPDPRLLITQDLFDKPYKDDIYIRKDVFGRNGIVIVSGIEALRSLIDKSRAQIERYHLPYPKMVH